MIARDFKNELLNRREIELVVKEKSNPGFEKAKKHISEKFKANEDLIVVNAVRGKFGANAFLIEAFIYDSAQNKEMLKPRKSKEKGAKK